MIAQSALARQADVSQSLRFPLSSMEQDEIESFPEVVKRSLRRAARLQEKFGGLLEESKISLPERSCVCLSGSVSRLESVEDSDIDYVLIWNDGYANNGNLDGENDQDRLRAREAVSRVNSMLASKELRPCDSFSCDKALSDLISTENLFSRYSILTLIDSTFAMGSEEAYYHSLKKIEEKLGEYAINVSAETQVTRTLLWYIQREGWMDQLHYGTSVNRFSRLIQLFATILSINQFGIDETRKTKTTWLRIEKLEPYVAIDTVDCLKKLWVRSLELKERRSSSPMLSQSGFTGVSKLVEIWKMLYGLSQTPLM